MKKLWIATELFYPEETSTSFILTKIANKLTEKYEVEVICGEPTYDKNSAPNSNFVLNDKVTVTRLKSGSGDKNSLVARTFKFVSLSLSIFFKLLTKVKKEDKVFIVTNPAPLVLLIALLKKLKGFELAVLVHDVFPENTIPAGIIKSKDKLIYKILTWFFDRAYASADRLIVLGRDMEDVVQKKIGGRRNAGKITIIENWAETENIVPRKKSEVDPYEKDIIEKVVFQYAGNIGRVQGLLELLEIIKEVKNPDLLFYFVGEGAVKKQMQEFAVSHQLQNVQFAGSYKREEQNNILNRCDISIITLSDGMYGFGVPSKTYNVLAAGKPILFIGDAASEVGRLVAEEQIGYSFNHQQKKEILDFFNNFNADTENIQDKSLKARQLAEEKYSEEVILNKFKEII